MAEKPMLVDTLAMPSRPALPDSLSNDIAVPQLRDSLTVGRDSLAVSDSLSANVAPLDPKAVKKAEKEKIKAEKKSKREAEKKRKQEALEAKWAEKDKRDAEKEAEKEAKRLAKERQRKRKALQDAAERARKEADLLEQYRKKYMEQKSGSK